MPIQVKDVEYYMPLPYQINIVTHIEDGDTLYEAYIPELGGLAVCGDGGTIAEALQSLEESKRFNFEQWLNEGYEIPEPILEESSSISNRQKIHA